MSWSNQRHWCHCIATCHWFNHPPTSIERPDCSKSSRAPALWRHDRDFSNQNTVVLPILNTDLPCLRKKIRNQNAKWTWGIICKFKEETLDSRQVRFFLINVLFSLKSSGPLNCILPIVPVLLEDMERTFDQNTTKQHKTKLCAKLRDVTYVWFI